MDFYHYELRDVIKHCLLPILDPLSKIIFTHAIYRTILPHQLKLNQLIVLSEYPELIKYFGGSRTYINRAFVKSESFMLQRCIWYPYYYKTNTYVKYTSIGSHEKCTCIKCRNLGFATVEELVPFLLGIQDKSPTKTKRYRTKYENRLYAFGMICSGRFYDVDISPFKEMLRNHLTEILIYFAVISRNLHMLSNLLAHGNISSIDRSFRWTQNDDFIWVAEQLEVEEQVRNIYCWAMEVLCRDRLSNFYLDV